MTWNYETKTIKDENYFYEFCEEYDTDSYK